jgi:murein DD-endopeptidase MepM/ murein hydrolase activator NlpD
MKFYVLPLLIGVAFVSSCADVQVTDPHQNVDDNPSYAISDGAHANGNAHFFFLPPIAPPAVYSGTFDPTLSPEVMICEWAGSACVSVVAHFTTTGTGAAAETVRLAGEQYMVNWKTSESQLDPSSTYRIRVLVEGDELGYADVDVLNNGSERRGTDQTQFVPVVNGSTLPIRFRIEEDAVGAGAGASVGAGGGAVDLANVARIEFPAGFFATDRIVRVTQVEDAAAMAQFTEFEGLFRVGMKTNYQVRVLAGETFPLSGTASVVLTLPADFVIPAGQRPQLFAQVFEDVGMSVLDNFQLLPSSYDPTTRTLTASLSVWAFTRVRRSDGQYEALFMIGSTPTGGVSLSAFQGGASALFRQQPGDPALCQAGFIGSPVGGNPDPSNLVTSPYGVRTHPITGAQTMHWGTDFGIATGTQVTSAANGVVERVQNGTTGFGVYVIVRHTDGSASLYAHLQAANVVLNQAVTRGQQIATSNNTGSSTGPHLHFEYVPNGAIIQSQGRIDPFPCVQPQTVQGGLTVRDNGNLADDAFSVYLDGILVGTTAIGASNNFALNNLIPGAHSLRITGVVVPDNVGTYEVILANNITFDGGGSVRSGVVPAGGSVTFGITVPPPATQPRTFTFTVPITELVDEAALVRNLREKAGTR